MSHLKVKRALLSVSDKSGLVELAKRLHQLDVVLMSTGGTAETLRQAGLPVQEVSDYTAYPEMMAGRVKTLHPKIHGGLLGRRGVDDAVMQEHGIEPIDLVVVNLYPFQNTVAKANVTLAEAIENIDIGGPSMLRSAAKNHASVAVVCQPSDYPKLISALENQNLDLALRQKFALKVFEHTAQYDRAIADYLLQQYHPESALLPQHLHLSFERQEVLRYGENPHQHAAFYASLPVSGLAAAKQWQGKALSYNNLADADAALQCVLRFHDPACVIVKHANPCGVALGEHVLSAYDRAHRCDPTSAFGGIIAFNRALNAETAQEILSRQFVEVILAPAFSEEALQVLQSKPNVRVLEIKEAGETGISRQISSVRGGLLVQEWDNGSLSQSDLKVVSARAPSKEELQDLLFAWRVVKAVKSNAIVLAKDLSTIGIGAGQTSRVYSAKIAGIKAADEGLEVAGCVLSSDAFFPFRDGVDAAAASGVRAIIQPGGSMRDEEVIAAANEHDMAMIFTGMRHFKH